MASPAFDLILTYRIIRTLVLPWNKMDAYKRGIIDDNGKVLRKARTLTAREDKVAYTYFHRFVFNIKRILSKVGLGSRLGAFATALALLIKEDKSFEDQKFVIESAIIHYLKENGLYDDILNESREIQEIDDTPIGNYFGVDVYEVNGELVSEYEYAKTL